MLALVSPLTWAVSQDPFQIERLSDWLPPNLENETLEGSVYAVDSNLLLFVGSKPSETNEGQDPRAMVWSASYDNEQTTGTTPEWSKLEGARAITRVAGMSLSHSSGVILLGGHYANQPRREVERLHRDHWMGQVRVEQLPQLPDGAVVTSAVVGDVIYVAMRSDATEIDPTLHTLNLAPLVSVPDATSSTGSMQWQQVAGVPVTSGASRVLQTALVARSDGDGEHLYLARIVAHQQSLTWITPEGQTPNSLELWSFNPRTEQWRQRSEIAAYGNWIFGLSVGSSHVWVLSTDRLLSFNTITNAISSAPISGLWSSVNGKHFEIAPRVTSHPSGALLVSSAIDSGGSKVELWHLNIPAYTHNFGWLNTFVLVIYLLVIVGIGVYFTYRNTDTDKYFRGGQSIPWWAAACSIYATMVSSLSFVAFPALIYRTDWRIFISALTIFVTAPIAIYIVMPFFRKIDATSAYEYLSKRFNMGVRLFASMLFTVFHISRMGIVMALTALALAAVTPFSATHCVLIMGVLCLVYCTLGGIEGVIWTDTAQALVLLVGGATCVYFLLAGIDGGFVNFIEIGRADNKFTLVDLDFGADSALTLSLWVVVLGGIGQQLSSYTADQAIVQRYMVTKNEAAAAKSLWLNVGLSLPGGLLFYVIGTALYGFYKSNPERLDPTIQTDQILPFFVAQELPVGVAGLIIAAIFAAAQSTVSTSMNSLSSTLVTDFLRPFSVCTTEHGYLNAARWLTLFTGMLGTSAGLIFIDPSILSLMEAYFKVIGMFMGALGGLFILGMVSKRASGASAMLGLLAGVGVMVGVWHYEWANGFIFATIGIFVCLTVGYGASWILPSTRQDLGGLTLQTMGRDR